MVAKTRSNGNQSRIDVSLNRFYRKLFAVNWQGKFPSTWQKCLPIATAIFVFWNVAVLAEKAPPDAIKMAEELKVNLDTAWVTIATMLVIFMNAGFCMLETGFCRDQNAVNVLAKNPIVFALSSLAFWVIGFGLMFSEGNNFIGTGGFFLAGADNSPAIGDAYKGIFTPLNWTGVPLSTKFFFQLAFAGTAATIVSGAVAERIKFISFLLFSLLLIGVVYPITGHWIWGGGWLADLGFFDFAGSTVVHAVGGWAALVGAWILGPRIGKYTDDGRANAAIQPSLSIFRSRSLSSMPYDACIFNLHLDPFSPDLFMTSPLIGIIMGSDSDLPTMKAAIAICEQFEVPHEVAIVSAHRTPERMVEYAQTAHQRGLKVIIAGAGGAAHLPGMVASLTPLPVIGVPVQTKTLQGVDSLYSIVQMPAGIPVATVAIGNATNAGLLAVQILAIHDPALLDRVQAYRQSLTDMVLDKQARLEEVGYSNYLSG